MKMLELFYRIFVERTFYMCMLKHNLKICHKCEDSSKKKVFDSHYEKYMYWDGQCSKNQKRVEELLSLCEGK